ncbi:MAG: dihydropteroate synthase [Gemmatimonadota bacterium]|nr:dihydropteroate synthase [Gemmatimonadota bacterium]
MRLTPLAPHPAALREALVRRGVPEAQATSAVEGWRRAAVVLDDVPPVLQETLSVAARDVGASCVSGRGWMVMTGDAAGLAGLARPDRSFLPTEIAAALGAALRALVEPPLVWGMARGAIALDRPVVVGILNVTPDSFSDGGRFVVPAAAVAHAETLLAAGADALDLGAESTRPGRPSPVPADEEWRRLVPVLRELVRRWPAVPISVDTVKATTAERALEEGAWAINDVSGLRHDPAVATVCAARDAGLIVMHSRGALAEMATYDHAEYADVTADVRDELAGALERAAAGGLAADRVVIDPGLGFAKRPEHNLQVLDRLDALATLGRPILVGPSRKRFLGTGAGDPAQRDVATAAACVVAAERGAHLFRVHDVATTRAALDIAHAARTGPGVATTRPTAPPPLPAGRGEAGA